MAGRAGSSAGWKIKKRRWPGGGWGYNEEDVTFRTSLLFLFPSLNEAPPGPARPRALAEPRGAVQINLAVRVAGTSRTHPPPPLVPRHDKVQQSRRNLARAHRLLLRFTFGQLFLCRLLVFGV